MDNKPQPFDPGVARAQLNAAMNLDRVALLCDRLLGLGVPRPKLLPVIDWLNAQKPSGCPRTELPK